MKETVKVSRRIWSLVDVVKIHRVNILVDSSVLHSCWEKQYTSCHSMLEALKDLFWMTVDLNAVISLQLLSRFYFSSPFSCGLHPYSLYLVDCPKRVQRTTRSHVCDLMALDSNAKWDPTSAHCASTHTSSHGCQFIY